ncbi:MAG: DUF427 domain-containing protein [Chloroflexi bacterium]|nr:MAG: DUF427 domain-containing protein [Chloroflexota bacterium]
MSRDRIGLIFEPTQRHIRVEFNGEIVADSKRAMLLRESRYELHYLFPVEDVRQDFLVESDHVTHSAYKGDRKHWHVKVGYDDAENAAFQYAEVKNDRPDLTGYIGFEWDAMDAWYEEDEQVFLHPRDPYHRVDTLRSSRHIRVEIDGVTIAETRNPILLFETGIPVRYYIPEEDVQMDLLTPTELNTHCPYKGDASYWTATVNGETHENIVWSYKHPFDEIPKIKGLLSFYNEKVNIYVDGELEERPNTVFA